MFSKVGTAEVATDPMPPNVADNFVMLKPRDQWPDPKRSKADLVAAIEKRVEDVPGNNYEFTQPIQMRFNELISGVRSDVGIKVFGDNLDTLLQVANRVQAVIQRHSGRRRRQDRAGHGPAGADREARPRGAVALRACVGDVQNDRRDRDRRQACGPGLRGGPALRPGRAPAGASARRHGRDWRTADPAAGAGRQERRSAHAALASLSPALQRYVPLAAVATIESAPRSEPDQPRERQAPHRGVGQRARARSRLLRRGGAGGGRARRASCRPATGSAGAASSSNSSRRRKRLTIVVPVALLLIFLLLFMSLGSAADALLVFSGVPLALTGGVARAAAARHSAFDQRRHRLHRLVGRGGAQRPRHHRLHPESARRGPSARSMR